MTNTRQPLTKEEVATAIDVISTANEHNHTTVTLSKYKMSDEEITSLISAIQKTEATRLHLKLLDLRLSDEQFLKILNAIGTKLKENPHLNLSQWLITFNTMGEDVLYGQSRADQPRDFDNQISIKINYEADGLINLVRSYPHRFPSIQGSVINYREIEITIKEEDNKADLLKSKQQAEQDKANQSSFILKADDARRDILKLLKLLASEKNSLFPLNKKNYLQIIESGLKEREKSIPIEKDTELSSVLSLMLLKADKDSNDNNNNSHLLNRGTAIQCLLDAGITLEKDIFDRIENAKNDYAGENNKLAALHDNLILAYRAQNSRDKLEKYKVENLFFQSNLTNYEAHLTNQLSNTPTSDQNQRNKITGKLNTTQALLTDLKDDTKSYQVRRSEFIKSLHIADQNGLMLEDDRSHPFFVFVKRVLNVITFHAFNEKLSATGKVLSDNASTMFNKTNEQIEHVEKAHNEKISKI